MAKPNRTLCQSKAPTPAQLRSQKDKIAKQKTQQMADAAYRRTYRHAQVAIARQKAKADAMKDAGFKPQQQQPPVTPAAKQHPPKAAKPPRVEIYYGDDDKSALPSPTVPLALAKSTSGNL